MKYMGSKRWMLQNGLGDLIARELKNAKRFVDFFAGSAAVATHVATKYRVPVAAYDLQTFSVVLSRAIIGREAAVDSQTLWAEWYGRAKEFHRPFKTPLAEPVSRNVVNQHRDWCAEQSLLVTKSYGGHYFSADQAVWLDSLLRALPENEPLRTIALAATVRAASQCAAAPGHTAQPFQPTTTAKPFLVEAWGKHIPDYCEAALAEISKQHANIKGIAEVADANQAARTISEGDLAFVDPPYSGVHYSRFYHVLETIARGRCAKVSGTGRYPDRSERPRSNYSLKSKSSVALGRLFHAISSRGGNAILTFPQRKCSNGLSGTAVTRLARQHFDNVEAHWVASKFSTLGGNNEQRHARRSTRELILVMHPR